jgi:hypothetical protein
MGRFWHDGSFVQDIPSEALQQAFGVRFTIVSMVEPHIAPFFFSPRGGP